MSQHSPCRLHANRGLTQENSRRHTTHVQSNPAVRIRQQPNHACPPSLPCNSQVVVKGFILCKQTLLSCQRSQTKTMRRALWWWHHTRHGTTATGLATHAAGRVHQHPASSPAIGQSCKALPCGVSKSEQNNVRVTITEQWATILPQLSAQTATYPHNRIKHASSRLWQHYRQPCTTHCLQQLSPCRLTLAKGHLTVMHKSPCYYQVIDSPANHTNVKPGTSLVPILPEDCKNDATVATAAAAAAMTTTCS